MSNSLELVEQVAQSGVFDDMAPPLKVALFLGSLAFLTTALVTVTAFTRIVIVLSFVRRALSTQEIPPTPVILGLSIFLTFFVMGPTFDQATETAIVPYINGKIEGGEAISNAANALHGFMVRQVRKRDLARMALPGSLQRSAQQRTSQAWLRLFL